VIWKPNSTTMSSSLTDFGSSTPQPTSHRHLSNATKKSSMNPAFCHQIHFARPPGVEVKQTHCDFRPNTHHFDLNIDKLRNLVPCCGE
jgi:hypothetical protein